MYLYGTFILMTHEKDFGWYGTVLETLNTISRTICGTIFILTLHSK